MEKKEKNLQYSESGYEGVKHFRFGVRRNGTLQLTNTWFIVLFTLDSAAWEDT